MISDVGDEGGVTALGRSAPTGGTREAVGVASTSGAAGAWAGVAVRSVAMAAGGAPPAAVEWCAAGKLGRRRR